MFEVPTSLSPSRVDAFVSCPLAFRFASIEKLPEPPSEPATRGSLVHRALERFFVRPAAERDASALGTDVDRAIEEYRDHPDLVGLGLDAAALARFEAESRRLALAYLDLEDPTEVREIGVEIRLEAEVDGLTLRGIIDRLELDPAGGLVVTDYKTGRAPAPAFERKSLAGVHFYAFLCQAVFGVRPAAIRLVYLSSGQVITAAPTERSIRFLTSRTRAVWQAIERACTTGDFRPRPGPLCNWCSFRTWCPEFGGDPDRAAAEAPLVAGATR